VNSNQILGVSVDAWNAGGTIASAAAAIVVAVFAWIQLARQSAESRDRRAGAAAKISAAAYLLRGKLRAWLFYQRGGSGPDSFDQWIDRAKTSEGLIERETDEAVALARQLMDLLPDAAPATAKRIRKVFVILLEGVRRTRLYGESGMPDGVEIFDWSDLRSHAEQDFRDCVTLLEGGVIEPLLLNEAGILDRTRYQDTIEGAVHKAIDEGEL
jgi:hypothetical protein